MKKQTIILKNVSVHNLKNISLEFPTQELIVLSGVSGSGKSSLAFDTIYTEGQRRYIESLSNYLKKQLGGLPKPEAESIEGITPTIAIEQKSVSKNPRSTVVTLTGIQDFLRIIFAKIAIPYCPISKTKVSLKILNLSERIEIDRILKSYPNERVAPSVTTKLIKQIHSIEGDVDKNKIAVFVESMPIGDSKFIRRFIFDNEPRLDLRKEVIAPSGERVMVDITFGVEFFRPFLSV